MSDGTDYQRMTRDELNAYAGEVGIVDAAAYPNKADLLAAIDAALSDADAASAAALASDAEPNDQSGDAEPEQSGTRYEVLKAVTDDEGRTYMPGEHFVPGSGFPSRRPKQLVDQKYLRPLE
jgi:hypothetical protein